MDNYKKSPADKFSIAINKILTNEKSGGIILVLSVIGALIIANSSFSHAYFTFFEHKFGFSFNGGTHLEHSLLQWINDGLMAIFFFVVGLELKKEFVAGELSSPRKALLPIGAALGGMIVPALIYFLFNPTGEVNDGWGIPMATDIALALGVISLLGKRVPISLKIFLTALAIVDDLGAVLVIAFFYTSDVSFINLLIGAGFLMIMYAGNRLGVRNFMFYAIIGIVGVWTAFLLSGVHATIAAVMAAFTIPANVKVKENLYIQKLQEYIHRFQKIAPDDKVPTIKKDQQHILEKVKNNTHNAIPPLQELEHFLSPFATFVVLPIFAFANAGVSFMDIEIEEIFNSNVALGTFLGLLVGKVIGVVGFAYLIIKLKITTFPIGMNIKNLIGVSFLASIGFTMSLFITSLAFTHPEYSIQAKVGIFAASIIGGLIGYILLRNQKNTMPNN